MLSGHGALPPSREIKRLQHQRREGRIRASDVNLGAPATKITLEEIAKGIRSPRGEIVERLRSIVRKTLPEVVETVKWSQPLYIYRGKNPSCIILYDDHVNLGFAVRA